MSKTNLKIYAKFPTWDDLSEPVKSLINFFMKNASVVFRGEYRDSSFQYMSGNVRNKCYSSFDETEEYWNYSLELNIAYFPFDPSEEYDVVDGFPNGSSTVAPLTSSLELLELTEDGTYTETDLLSGGIPIPVILTPKSGDTVINNPRLKPKDIKTNYHHIVEIPIETDGLDFMYDFQLRSSSFYIDDGEGGIEADVFYKIGICPFHGNSMESIMESLQENKLSMKLGDFLFYKLLDGSMAVGKKFTADGNYKFSTNLAFPLSVYDEEDDAYTYVGMAYIELYNQDGTVFTEDLTDTDIIISCRPSENEEPEEVDLEYDLGLTITDQDMNGGFIYTEYRKLMKDDITQPLMFISNQDGSTVSFNSQYDGSTISFDGNTWENYSNNRQLTLNNGDRVYFKSNKSSFGSKKFSITGSVSAYNNVNSLLRSNNFQNFTDLSSLGSYGKNALLELFKNCRGLTRAPLLPATVLTENCYNSMFYGCTSLTKAPSLPATTLDTSCYSGMFYNCISLVDVSNLPATTLPSRCYATMFYGCTSLTKPPRLPSTVMGVYCYSSMFSGCTALTQTPDLPATTLATGCYSYMFSGCTALTSASILPATTLVEGCYNNMFYGCTALTQPPRILATTVAPNCCYQMFYRCSALTQAPELLATTLASSCYSNMFRECTSLTQVPDLSATTMADFCYYEMFQDCTSLIQAPSISAINMVNACCYQMFYGCSALVQPPQILPAEILASRCYEEMFVGCSSLRRTPEIQATTLAEQCCYGMFRNCTSLTQISFPPATTLASSCYASMFSECTSLVHAPTLPATTLASSCCNGMFMGCTSLTQAPELPAMTLSSGCYAGMFRGCTSLEEAPFLPATTLVGSCYYDMFYDCTHLNKVRIAATSIPYQSCLDSWLLNVSSSGDFYSVQGVTYSSGSSGIPYGWVQHDLVA